MSLARILLICFVLLCSCTQRKQAAFFSSPPGYDFANPTIIHLKAELDEISGIAYYAKDSSLFAINDELGVLYKISLRKQIKIQSWEFSETADYEDIVLKDSIFYILQSNGNIDAVSFSANDNIRVETFASPFTGVNNFETLYFDNNATKLVLICKKCWADNKGNITAYSFNPDDATFCEEPSFKLNTDSISQMLGSLTIKFKPSAAAINPVSKDLYILSSVEKVLIVADVNGTLKEAYFLDPKFFKQPEGISFAPNGDLFISNESAEVGAATVLQYKYKRATNEEN